MSNFLKNLFDKKSRVEKVDVARRFELLARVGQGSMSKVWRARDNMTGRMLAVKVLDKFKTDRFEARFVGLKKPGEGEIAISLQHANIVHTIEHGTTTDSEPYLVMDFVEGTALSYLVDTQNEQMRDNCLNYVIQLGEGISYLHRQNWIHRDICPRNVMVDSSNVVKLIDFGLVVPNTPDFQRPGNRTGTANYMAPELIKRQRTDQRIDIFSFAVTAYEMFAKRLPWDVSGQETLETVLQHINKPPKPIANFAPHIDARVAEVLMKGLETNPDHRWQTVSEMLVPLRKAHEEIGAKQQLQQKLKAASAKAKAAKSKGTSGEAAAKAQKTKDDDDFYEQILHGEAPTKGDKPAAQSTGSTIQKSSVAKSQFSNSKPAKSVKAAAPKPKPKIAEPDIVVEDEFDGIEIEEEGHKLDGVATDAESSDEFEGIEIEVDGDLPVEPESSTKPPASVRKLSSPLADESPAATRVSIEASLADDDDDEPVLRLPDDD